MENNVGTSECALSTDRSRTYKSTALSSNVESIRANPKSISTNSFSAIKKLMKI
jgi:hypothetical protein